MKHEYTWSHILLLATVCGIAEDDDSVTAKWVQITEDHNRQTFPFTLWPLTYRTCEVTTSPAMCSPLRISSSHPACDYDVTMIKCNEVVIICIQHNSSAAGRCEKPSLAVCTSASDENHENDDDEDEDGSSGNTTEGESDADAEGCAGHVEHHSSSTTEPLLPCHVSHCYDRIKTKIGDAFYGIQDNVECVVCTGHGAAAAIASCLASDMSKNYEAEKEFLGFETRRVVVDFVGFSRSVVASPAYWEQHSSFIDAYVSVGFEDGVVCADEVRASLLVVNPQSDHVKIPGLVSTPAAKRTFSRSISVFDKVLKRGNKSRIKDSGDRLLSEYISALRKQIVLPIQSNFRQG